MARSQNRKKFVSGEDMSISDDDLGIDAESTIEDMMRQENSALKPEVKELFDEDKVKARTDLSSRQVKLITKAYYLAELTGMPEIKVLIHDFLTLNISKDRKSRLEYVEGLKARIEKDMMSGINNMRGQFGR